MSKVVEHFVDIWWLMHKVIVYKSYDELSLFLQFTPWHLFQEKQKKTCGLTWDTFQIQELETAQLAQLI